MIRLIITSPGALKYSKKLLVFTQSFYIILLAHMDIFMQTGNLHGLVWNRVYYSHITTVLICYKEIWGTV